MKDGTEIIAVVGKNVRRARQVLGWSQERLGFEADLDRTYISQVERNKRNITIVVLNRIAIALSTTARDLLTPAKSESKGKRG